MVQNTKTSLPHIGWYEWVSLPELNLPKILAKIDTGARTSALHAFEVNLHKEKGIDKISFCIHPSSKNKTEVICCTADLLDCRNVTDSGGHTEQRYVIKTPVNLGGFIWPIEITLTNRDNMSFRMLLGRSALRQRFLINPARKCLLSKKHKGASA